MSRYESWLEVCGELGHIAVATYGGGDSFRASQRVKEIELVGDFTEATSLQELCTEEANKWVSNYNKVSKEKHIAQVPTEDSPNFPIVRNQIHWSHTARITKIIPDVPHYNIMLHGWLLKNEFDEDKERLGASAWPLVGISHPVNIETDNLVSCYLSKTGEVSQWTGIESVNACDTHCHWVEDYIELDGCLVDLSGWNIGGDMGRFRQLDKGKLSFTWVMAVCPLRKLGQISLVIILPKDVNETDISQYIKDNLSGEVSEQILQQVSAL